MRNVMKSLFKWIMDHPITMSLAGFTLAIAMNVWLAVVVVASFLLLVSTLFMSVTMSRRAYLLSQDVKVRWMLFLFVFVSGWVMYGRIGIDDTSCSWGNRLSEVNRVIAAFFPSRGGFELEGGGEVSGQYSLTNTVSALITNSVSRLGESKRNNDAYCVKSHSEALLRTETDEISDESKFLYYAWHFCAVSFVSMLLYSVFFGLYSIGYMKRLWDFRIRREFNLDLAYTFWGDSEAARVLAKSVTENGHKAIFQIARDSFREGDITKNMVLNLFKYQKCAVVFVAGLPDENHDEFSEGERIHLDVADVYSDHHFILGENTRFNVRLGQGHR